MGTTARATKDGQPPTAKDLRQKVVDITHALKGHQRTWKTLTYDVTAGVAGAREALETTEQTISECDREIARLYSAIEEAEARETATKRARVAALEAALEHLLMDIDARLAVARETLLSMAYASEDKLFEAYTLLRQDCSLANEVQNLTGKRIQRPWSLDQFGSVHAARLRTFSYPGSPKPRMDAPWKDQANELKALQRELGIDNRPIGQRESWTMPASQGAPPSGLLVNSNAMGQMSTIEEIEMFEKAEANAQRGARARHGVLQDGADVRTEEPSRSPRPGSPMALRRELE